MRLILRLCNVRIVYTNSGSKTFSVALTKCNISENRVPTFSVSYIFVGRIKFSKTLIAVLGVPHNKFC